jgi:hypothetical protein
LARLVPEPVLELELEIVRGVNSGKYSPTLFTYLLLGQVLEVELRLDTVRFVSLR